MTDIVELKWTETHEDWIWESNEIQSNFKHDGEDTNEIKNIKFRIDELKDQYELYIVCYGDACIATFPTLKRAKLFACKVAHLIEHSKEDIWIKES